MTFNFFTILTTISLFMTAILALFFFVTKRGFALENRLLALLLIVFDLQIFYSYTTSVFAFEYFMAWHKPLFIIRQTSFLIGPLIYFYINSFLKRKEVFLSTVSLHFLPFSITVMFLFLYNIRVDRFVIWESVLDFDTTILILIQNLIYIVLSVQSMRSENTGFKDLFKSLITSPQHRWLQVLLIGFILVWIVNLNSFALYMIIQRPGWCAYTESIYALTVFLLISAILFILLLKPDAYYIVAKYRNTRLKESDKSEFLQRLETYMKEKKPYLNPDITLEFLAREISVNPRILSQIINETYKKNFKGYILEYRIRESMKILADSRHSRLTVLEVLYQVGFNSKSAFNNQFKLYTHQTPLEYRARFIGE